MLPMSSLSNFSKKASLGPKKKIKAVSKVFRFRKNDYNLAKNTEFLARSIFSSSANVAPLMTNVGALEL